MSKKILPIILIVLGILILVGIPVFLFIHAEEIYYEDFCVDGDGDVNLEGIMCEKGGYSVFGNEDVFDGLVLLPFIGIVFILIGFVMYQELF